jgi:hypothetical protein
MSRGHALRRRYGRAAVSLSQPLRVYAQHIINALVRDHLSAREIATQFGMGLDKARDIAALGPRAFGGKGPGFEWAVRKTARIMRRDWS